MYLPIFGLPPSGLTTNKRKMAHALQREPSYCLSSVVELLAVFENREQEQKAQYMYVFYIKSTGMERARVENT